MKPIFILLIIVLLVIFMIAILVNQIANMIIYPERLTYERIAMEMAKRLKYSDAEVAELLAIPYEEFTLQ